MTSSQAQIVVYAGPWPMSEILDSSRSHLHDPKDLDAHPVGHISRPWGKTGPWYRSSSDGTSSFVSHDRGKTWSPEP